MTATRVAEPLSEAAASISVITAKTIEENVPQTFAETLLDVPNVDVTSSESVMFNRVSIRGSDANQITYLIDGMRQEDTTIGGNQPVGLFIDPEMVKQVEVRRGGGSSLYGNGGIGGTVDGEAFSYNYDLPNDSAYSETCAAISLAFFARRMLELAPKAEYADVMESALYNTTLAGMALDGKSFFYVNPLEVNPYACHKDSRLRHVKPVRQKWFGCACCPPNIARIVESVQEYAYTVAEDGGTLFTHLYMGGVAKAELNGTAVELDVTANLPWQGDGKAVVRLGGDAAGTSAQAPARFTLAFRLPGWVGDESAAAAAITATGESESGADSSRVTREIRDGYLYLTGEWRDGDTVTFDFPMPVRMLAANPLVREDAGKVAFVRGPITFCAEEKDNGANLHLLHADTEALLADPSVAKVEEFDFHAGAKGIDDKGQGEVEDVTRRMVKLEVPAWREPLPAAVAAAGEGAAEVPAFAPLYAVYAPVKREPATATLIPYFAWANRGENEMTVWLRG